MIACLRGCVLFLELADACLSDHFTSGVQGTVGLHFFIGRQIADRQLDDICVVIVVFDIRWAPVQVYFTGFNLPDILQILIEVVLVDLARLDQLDGLRRESIALLPSILVVHFLLVCGSDTLL